MHSRHADAAPTRVPADDYGYQIVADEEHSLRNRAGKAQLLAETLLAGARLAPDGVHTSPGLNAW